MNDLERYFTENKDRLIHKWMHYFEIYDRHFSRYRGKEVVVVEIGVFQGGSLRMWKNYFGDKAKIFGIDIDPRCKSLEENGVEIIIGSQSDRKFMSSLKERIPPIDILIDDGGHSMKQQIVTFEELFPYIKDEGVYLCEDLHTSYWTTYGGGHKRRGTFIEYSKNFIDYLNAFHSTQKSLKINDFTRSVDSVHYYTSVAVVEKKPREQPQNEMSGIPSFDELYHQPKKTFIRSATRKMLIMINNFLRFFKLQSVYWK